MEHPEEFIERRKCPRSLVDLPVEYRIKDLPLAHGGVMVNASEEGLLIQSGRNMPLGAKLNIVVLFLREYELAYFDITAEIIWKDFQWDHPSEGYQYGLKIVRILDEDHWKLKQILNRPLKRGEDPAPSPSHPGTSLLE